MKSVFLVLEEKKTKYFSLCFSSDSTLKTIHGRFFLNARKKVIYRQKRHFSHFWWLIIFFAFSKIPT